MAVAVGLLAHRVVDFRDIVVHDSRRENLRRDPAVARCVKRTAERVLRHAVRPKDIVIGQLVSAVRIRMGICHACDIVGDLCRLGDVLRIAAAAILETSLSAVQSECDMPLIARDDPRRAARRRIDRKVDIRPRVIELIPVVDLLRTDLKPCRAVVDLEAVTRNLAPDDIAVEVELTVRHSRLRAAQRKFVEQLIVPRISTRQADVGILQLVAADMNLLIARRIGVLWVRDRREIDIVDHIAVVAHDLTFMMDGRCHRRRRRYARLIQCDIRRGARLQHFGVKDIRRAVVDFVVRLILFDMEIDRCLGDGRTARQVAERRVVEGVVYRICAGKTDRSAELDGLVRADVLVEIRPCGSECRIVHHLCLEAARGEIKVDRTCRNILRRKARGTDASARQRGDKCIRDVALAVIHAVRVDRPVVEANLARLDRDIDPAQIRSLLILRPEDRLRPLVADAVRRVQILPAHIALYLRGINISAERHIRYSADGIRRVLVDNLQVVAVVLGADVRPAVRFNIAGRIQLAVRLDRIPCRGRGRAVRLKVAVVVRRCRRAVHKRRQHGERTTLVDAPLRPGGTVVIDVPACIGGRGLCLSCRRRRRQTVKRRLSCALIDRIGIVDRRSR